MPTGEDRESPASKALASRLAKYAYASTGPSPRRAVAAASTRSAQVSPTDSRLPENQAEGLLKDGAAKVDFDHSRPVAGPSRKRDIPVTSSGKRKTTTKEASSPGFKKAKKVPRPYAGPEVYAHLNNTPDHLAVGLDSE
jgi:TDG/mug DNA glycosylase family protein